MTDSCNYRSEEAMLAYIADAMAAVQTNGFIQGGK
jgi:hypothetical protein